MFSAIIGIRLPDPQTPHLLRGPIGGIVTLAQAFRSDVIGNCKKMPFAEKSFIINRHFAIPEIARHPVDYKIKIKKFAFWSIWSI